MVDEKTEAQLPLTLTTRSFVRGILQGVPCVVIYDAATDKTTVISRESKWYANAMAAMDILEAAATPIKVAPKKSVIHNVQRPRLILPGSNASN